MGSEPSNKMDPLIDKSIQSRDILIVDDEIPNLKLLAQFLAQEDYQVRLAERPQLAIDSAIGQLPAMILLDVRMPEMDGYTASREIRNLKSEMCSSLL